MLQTARSMNVNTLLHSCKQQYFIKHKQPPKHRRLITLIFTPLGTSLPRGQFRRSQQLIHHANRTQASAKQTACQGCPSNSRRHRPATQTRGRGENSVHPIPRSPPLPQRWTPLSSSERSTHAPSSLDGVSVGGHAALPYSRLAFAMTGAPIRSACHDPYRRRQTLAAAAIIMTASDLAWLFMAACQGTLHGILQVPFRPVLGLTAQPQPFPSPAHP